MKTLANSIKQSTQQRGNTKDKKGGGFKSEPKRTNKTPIPLGFVKPDLEGAKFVLDFGSHTCR